METYYLNFTSSKDALEVAARENASSQKSVYELKDILQKIALKDKLEESREFAEKIQTALFSLSARSNVKARDRGVKKAPFVVLIGASMPSVLAEIGFVSNPKDESLDEAPGLPAEDRGSAIQRIVAVRGHSQPFPGSSELGFARLLASWMPEITAVPP